MLQIETVGGDKNRLSCRGGGERWKKVWLSSLFQELGVFVNDRDQEVFNVFVESCVVHFCVPQSLHHLYIHTLHHTVAFICTLHHHPTSLSSSNYMYSDKGPSEIQGRPLYKGHNY